jgi:hypothetical protein
MATVSELTRPIRITQSSDNILVKIECKECDNPHKSLGIMAHPSMDPTAEIHRLKDKARKFKHQIMQGTIGRYATMRAYKSIYKGRIAYSLGATAIPRKHLEEVQKIINPTVLSRLGYNRHMPKQ